MKKTPWFDASTPPSRIGWYRVRGHFLEGRYAWRRWNGMYWEWLSAFSDGGLARAAMTPGIDEWRGLAAGAMLTARQE